MPHARGQSLDRHLTKGGVRNGHAAPVSFELWNTGTRNLYGSYATRSEAMRATRAIVETYGSEFASEFVLAAEDSDGDTMRIASGAELVQLACQEVPTGDAIRNPLGSQADVA